MSLFEDIEMFSEPLDPRVVDPGGAPLPALVRVSARQGRQVETVEEAAAVDVPMAAAAGRHADTASSPDLTITQAHGVATANEHAQESAVAAGPVVTGPESADDGQSTSRATGEEIDAPQAFDFAPGTEVRVPSGAKARVTANIAVIDVLARLDAEQRPASPAEQEVLAGWSGWGAVPDVFDVRKETYAAQRAYLKSALTPAQYRAAEASILNAHYTDPAVAAAMWQAVQAAGFSGGRVLEPGCGSGTFIGLAPAEAQMVGVENDPITAAVAAHLYPSAQVRLEGFEDTRVPNGSFAAVVGNVPFGNFTVGDPAHNPGGLSIHNHFIIKSLNLTAPGGYVVLLTSRYTMDATNTKARAAIAERAELIGAVRLPSRAFQRVAGTAVVADVLVLRRREPGEIVDLATQEWVQTAPMSVLTEDGVEVEDTEINTYFHTHPEDVLGAPRLGHGLHGRDSLTVVGELDTVAEQLTARLTAIVDAAKDRDLGLTATPESLIDVTEISFDAGLLTDTLAGEIPLYTLRYNADIKQFQMWTGDQWAPHKVFKTREVETRALLSLRDAATAVITSQRDQAPLQQREHLRAHLNRLYDSYVSTYGLINRVSSTKPKEITQLQHDQRVAKSEWTWRKENPEHSGPVPEELAEQWDTEAWQSAAPQRRRPHLEGGLLNDPGWANLTALEEFDKETGAPRKAPIFSVDLLSTPVVIDHADTVEDALNISLDTRTHVDVEHIAGLLGESVDNTRALLRGLVYPSLSNPEQLVPASRALSGNVRRKLEQAEAAAETDPSYQHYVEALRAVVPADKMPSQINAGLGAPWIDTKFIEQFAAETFGVPARSVSVAHLNGQWSVSCPEYLRTTMAMTETWGTEQKDAIELLLAALNLQRITVERSDRDVELHGGPKIDRNATVAAQAKCSKIKDQFQKWVWDDQDRAEVLAGEFNRRFNSLRAPRHDGSRFTFPGMSTRYNPHYYQRNAVARILAEPTVLLDHVVGAGKSGTMFMGAMELKRLGLAKQPWLVVPNHLIEQVGREAKWWYPTAKILMGASGSDAEDRRRLAAQSAASDWDMVIVPQSVFERYNVTPERRLAYEQRELDELESQLRDAPTALSKKMIESALKRAKTSLKKLQDAKKEPGITFEQTGCDYLFIDEAHEYKNKQRTSQVQELSCPAGSKRATDLDLKLMVLRERRREQARAMGISDHDLVERVATFATGTPVANSLGELFVMQSYLRPDLLVDAGVADINDWGAAFTATVNTVEVNPTGTGLRPVSRVGKYTNLQELLAISSVFSDVVTRDQVPMELPQLVDGRRQIVTLTPSQEVKDFITDLAYRATAIDPKRMDLDNILKISNDGRNVSLDPRLANLSAPTGESRATAVAGKVMEIHRANAENVYLNPDTKVPMERRGALQIVFCDRGTPKEAGSTEFSMYTAIRDELIAQGMAPERIRFIHDAVKPEDRIRLFDECNRGDVSVLIGSTQKMGTGTNVQTRAVALHHVDVPWRPADLEQREGRIIRQGNQNKFVQILNYVTEGTFDTFMWQKVEAKSAFVEQVRRNDLDISEAEELGGEFTASAAETKAAATGDSRYIRQVQLQDEVQRLDALERAHLDAGARRERMVRDKKAEMKRTSASVETLAPLVDRIAERAEHPAQVRVGERTYTERKDAAIPFAQACRRAFDSLRDRPQWETRPIAVINGLQVVGYRLRMAGKLMLGFEVGSAEAGISEADLYDATRATLDGGDLTKARGLLVRAENIYKDIPNHLVRLRHNQVSQALELDDLVNTAAAEFEHRDELADKRTELEEVTAILRLEAESEAAKAAAAEAEDRMRAAGLTRGWSLELNPTPALLEQSGFESAEDYRNAYLLAAQERAADYRRLRAAEVHENGIEEAIEARGADDLLESSVDSAAEVEVEVVAAAGELAGAAVYAHPPAYWDRVPDTHRHAARTIAAGTQAIQVLTLAADVDKPAAIQAITRAAIDTNREHRVLAIPATDAARHQADTHRYAHALASPDDAHTKFATGTWANPPGTLLVIDDADHLPPDRLRFFIDHASTTNTKLLLVSTPTADLRPPHTHVAALAESLPWAQHIGEPHHHETAIAAARTVSTETTGPGDHLTRREHLRDLLTHHDTTVATYATRHHPNRSHHHETGDNGLAL